MFKTSINWVLFVSNDQKCFNFSTMVGENFEIYLSQMATNAVRGLYKIIKYKLKKLNFENVKIENSRTIQEPHPKKHITSRTTQEPCKFQNISRTFPDSRTSGHPV